MKTAIIGYSGSGKSTLAQHIALKHGIPVLYLDTVYWLPGWQERTLEEQQSIVQQFMDSHDSWVIEGNYTRVLHSRRMEEADQIIFMNFNRFTCLFRVLERYFSQRGQTRFSMAEGCPEKMDWDFITWVLITGRTGTKKQHYLSICRQYPEKAVIIRNQKQLDEYCKKNNL